MTEWRQRLNAPRDASSLAAFRILFGVVMLGSIGRYFANGWIERFYVRPQVHFTYWGFDWVQPLPQPGMTLLFVALAVFAAMIALGFFYRVATVGFFVGFTYVHLLDVSNYLNHYYLVSLLALLLCVLPTHKQWSVDAMLRPSLRATTLPAWMLYLVRFQIALVYIFAGLAKFGPDWLLHGQPLGIWLHSRTGTPVIGPWLDEPMIALAMSWAGFLYDTTIVFWLSWRRSRPFAYAVVLAFHFMTNVFFQIGIFSVVMTVAALVFFDPDWPRWLLAKLRRQELGPVPESAPGRWRIGGVGVAVLAVWALFHVITPLRSHLYDGDVLWHEQGMRWSWRVMVREKNGDVAFRVRVNGESRERVFVPNDYLTREQEIEFAGQPDLVLQLAHHIASDLESRGYHDVQIRADAYVSLNGRPSARMIDPSVDLATIDDGVAPAAWILPVPEGPPISLRSRRQRLAAR